MRCGPAPTRTSCRAGSRGIRAPARGADRFGAPRRADDAPHDLPHRRSRRAARRVRHASPTSPRQRASSPRRTSSGACSARAATCSSPTTGYDGAVLTSRARLQATLARRRAPAVGSRRHPRRRRAGRVLGGAHRPGVRRRHPRNRRWRARDERGQPRGVDRLDRGVGDALRAGGGARRRSRTRDRVGLPHERAARAAESSSRPCCGWSEGDADHDPRDAWRRACGAASAPSRSRCRARAASS